MRRDVVHAARQLSLYSAMPSVFVRDGCASQGYRTHFPGVYQIDDVKARSCNVMVVPGSGLVPKRCPS